jgi:hypothetical protein
MKLNTLLFPTLLILLLLLSACQSVQFKVIRPAKINVVGMTPEGKDATVSIGQWKGHSPNAIDSLIAKITQIILNSPKNIIKLESNHQGIVVLEGDLSLFRYEDKLSSQVQQCSRYNDRTKKHESYQCTVYTLTGTAKIKVAMKVLDGSNGQVLGGDMINETINRQTTAIDTQPEIIDGNMLLDQLESMAADKLAKLVVPYRDTVSREWLSCGSVSKFCDQAFKALQAEDFSGAKEFLFQAIKNLESNQGSDSDFAATWWALALAQEFSGEFSNAKASLEEALKYDSSKEIFVQELASIRREEENAKKLAKQGLSDE